MSADGTQLPEAGGTRERRQFQMRMCLGRGGFGEVYRATMLAQSGLRTEVAVKVLHAEVDPGSQAVQRLRDEGKLLGFVRHPSVLKVHDLCVLDGRVALVTEFVEGEDLDKCLAGSEPMPMRALIEVIARVTDALHAAYTAPSPSGEGHLELVHRDIKPANIRVGRHGEVKLLDFGIARAANVEREAQTATHSMLGSYLYMAPERLTEGNETGPSADVFGLGCALYEGIAHKRLFGTMSLKELYLMVLEEVRYSGFIDERLDELPSDTRTEVMQLMSAMLDIDPERRPSHDELSQTCWNLVDVLPGQKLDRWARQRRWPEPRRVRGMLDGCLITESGFTGLPAPQRMVVPTPIPLEDRLVDTRYTDDIDSEDLVRTVSATFERPSVVVGVGLASGMAVASIVAGIVVVVVVLVYWTLSQPRDQVVNVEIQEPVLPAPTPGVEPKPTPAPVRPSPKPIAAPMPAPEPTIIEVRPAPVPDPAPRPVVIRPAPAPPRPAPVDAAPALVTVSGGILVEFRGDQGTFRAGKVPPGSYDVYAQFETGQFVKTTQFHATPGLDLTINCTKMRRECSVK